MGIFSLLNFPQKIDVFILSFFYQATPTIYLKANFEYLRGNYRKAIKVLNTTSSESKPVEETGEALPVMYYNNLGVIHFYLKKHHLGAFYFRKAIEENERMCSEFHKEILGLYRYSI